jgi:tetratricopeptide (TPR) repeat protein
MDRFDWLELDSSIGIDAKSVQQKTAPPPRVQPHDAASFYRAAREMRESGHFKASTDFYRKAVGFDDRHYAARVELVDTLVRAGRIEEAEKAADEAYSAYRQVRPFYASRALVLAHCRRFDEALGCSDVSVEGGDRSWYSRCIRGEILLKMDPSFRFDALELFGEATALARAPWEPQFLSGWILMDAKLYALGAAHIAEAAHLNPRAPLCWLCLGDCFRELKFYEQAIFYYQRVMELEPTNELAVERQRRCSSLAYGLMRLFRRDDLHRRWRREFEKNMSWENERE